MTDAQRSRHIGVVINPERTDVGDAFIDALRDAGCTVTTSTPDSADGLADAVDGLIRQGVDAVAAVGGDGTQRTAAARLAGGTVALAVVPGGTVNLLAQVLGVADLDAAVGAAVSGDARTIDVGDVDDDVFVLNASTGWDADLIGHVDDAAKRFGRLGYAATGLREWVRSETRPVEVHLDGSLWYDDDALTVLVLNVGARGSDSLQLAPDARIDDGLLDVVVLRRKSASGFVRAAWATLHGRTPSAHDVVTGQATRVEVTWAVDVSVQRDGDEHGRTRSTSYRARQGALRVLTPASTDTA